MDFSPTRSPSCIYLDHAATTVMSREVADYLATLYHQSLGNSAAAHGGGIQAAALVENARSVLALRLQCTPAELVFTSGGTEGNNWILQRAVSDAFRETGRRPHLITSTIEHSSINRVAEWLAEKGYADWSKAPVDSFGRVRLADLEGLMRPETVLVSIGHANNEIGSIQDLSAIGKLCREKKVLFHTDACQTFCHLPINLSTLPVDFATINSHKICGPKGVGAVFIRKGVELSPLLLGGRQERGHRSGTLPVELICGFARASELWNQKSEEFLRSLRQRAIAMIREISSEAIINGADESQSLAHVLSVTFPKHSSKSLVSALSEQGIQCSAGAACNSFGFDASAVLLALGRAAEEAHHLRLSFGPSSLASDIDALSAALRKVLKAA